MWQTMSSVPTCSLGYSLPQPFEDGVGSVNPEEQGDGLTVGAVCGSLLLSAERSLVMWWKEASIAGRVLLLKHLLCYDQSTFIRTFSADMLVEQLVLFSRVKGTL